uniref:Uncharacterized protein n=1 Tax=viral metagenome TaxID=1070528 RepID=A0A6M3JTN1_9ZZZZ
MREFELVIDDHLKNGLTPFDLTPFNTPVLNECLGFRVGNAGLELYEELENPIDPALDIQYVWPFPQFIVGERYNFLIVRSVIDLCDYVYIISNDHLTTTLIATIDIATYGQGTLMEVADFGEYAFLTNGVVMIYLNTTTGVWHTVTSSVNIPRMRTVCNFKGQAVGGCIVSAWPATDPQCDATYYAWSRIGMINFIPTLTNEEGYKRCPYGGEVYNVRRLKDVVIGYSSKGITKLMPVSSPAATFGFEELSDIGLINRGAIAGSFDRHVYVGEDHRLREITKEGIKELGYKQYMEQLTLEPIIVSYDPTNKDFYIGNSSKTFLLSPKGLSEIPQHPSAVWRRDRQSYCLPETIDDYKNLIVTEAFDMGYSGQKTIFSIESNLLLASNPEAAVDYYLNPTTYQTTAYRPLNNQGIASLIAAGNAFRIRLRFDPFYDNSRISFIKVRYKMTDMRGIRGVYAPPPRGQS